ncbi:phage major capsid protein [Citrobacter sp. Awk 4]|uniref:phage major capsid protein n=1 Tax=Citrobacter sp. Awk 4 TaxID=2963955 RepID=UPI002302B0FB|nr:phage major capsid protein [Citrobacter sp. Awk 4]MDA8481079.1 phage major capsid protein [Citrobacter sp. Awk 4]
MAVEIKDVEQVAQELQAKFDDFRAKNDKRIDALESEKGKLAGEVDTLNGKLTELENLKSDLETELVSLKRPGGPQQQSKAATEHKTAFMQFMRKGDDDGLRELERKALQVGTDEDGGYAIPEELDRNILTLLKDEVVMRQESTVITVGGSEYKKLVSVGGTASGWVGETDARPATDASKLKMIEPFMGEIYGNPQATQKMLDDVFFNAEDWINSELATEFAEKEEIAFTTGDGTKKPKGFLAYASSLDDDKTRAFGTLQHILSGSAAAVTTDAIIKLVYTLRKSHRSGARFMMNNNTLFAIRILKDSEGNYLWRPGLEVNQPSTLVGYMRWEGVSDGLKVTTGSVIQRDDLIQYTATADAVSAGGVLRVPVACSVAGVSGNADDGTALILVTPVSGLPSSGMADTLTGGFDTEDLETWRARVIERYYWTPQGGADGDYVVWAKEVPGITRAWTYRHWMGTGTVGVMVASSDLVNPIPDDDTVTSARTHIMPLAPVAGSDLYVFKPVEHTVDFHVRITPDTPEIRAAVTAELRAFLLRDGYPEGELELSRINEAISIATGEYSHQLIEPAATIPVAKNELAVMGDIAWT